MLLVFPASRADAGFFSFFENFFGGAGAISQEPRANSQNVPLLSPVPSPNPQFGKGGGDISITDGSAFVPDIGPSGTANDTPNTSSGGQIIVYTVHQGDTLAAVAKMFSISPSTIMWANDLTSKTLHEGQQLTILPVSGVRYTVARGDTIQGIAKKFGGDAQEISTYNDLADTALVAGQSIIIPNGEAPIAPKAVARAGSAKSVERLLYAPKNSAGSGYFVRPLLGGILTQGLHGYNGVDLGAPIGTPVYAAASGEVIISKYSAGDPWFGGYGNYIAIKHDNGTQTVYGHLSAVYVSVGERVTQGQTIGHVGNTGHSTGPHLHFEVRGARNPFQ